MNTRTKVTLLIAFVAVVAVLLLFTGGMVTGATPYGGMMGSGMVGGINWIWIPALIILGLGVLLVWAIFGKK